MENLKIQIKIENNENLKEAHDLLLKLGFSTYSEKSFDVWVDQKKPIWLKTNCFDEQPGRIDWSTSDNYDFFKETTLPQLRDLVVLRRNDVKDITLLLKPIEKEMKMKEYLEKQADGNYELVLAYRKEGNDWIEVPEVATFYAEDSNMGVKGNYFFRLRSDDFNDEAIYLNNNWMRASFDVRNMTVLWQRSTQQEELPFIDDEPKSLNDQYAEIEQVRQSAWQKQEGGSHYKKLAIQPMEYALKNKLDYAQANVVKYVTRHADKNGKEDLLKAIHNIELMIEHYYS